MHYEFWTMINEILFDTFNVQSTWRKIAQQFKKDPMTLIEIALFIVNFSFLSFKMFDQVSNHNYLTEYGCG